MSIFAFKSTVFFYKCLLLRENIYKTTMIMQLIRPILLILLTFFTSTVIAQNVIRTVHEAKKGETLNSLSEYYSVTVDALLSVNPEMSSNPKKKIKRGYLVNIPERIFGDYSVVSKDTFCLAVVLPLSASGKEGERCLEYYRGLLMAVDKVRQNGRCIKVVAIDEPGVKKGISEVVSKLNNLNPDAIVGPLYPSHFQPISAVSQSKNIQTIVPFSSKVKEVETNPNLYLLNTPLSVVQEVSYSLFCSKFRGRRCVIIRTNDASDADVVNYWVNRLWQQNYEVHTLSQGFSRQELMSALSISKPNVIILDGSNKDDVLTILNKVHEYTNGGKNNRISVVGHNAWQLFSMEYDELFCTLDTYVLAQDYYNAHSKQVIDFEEKYYEWFKKYPLMLHPRMGELGYDTGLYLFTASEGDAQVDHKGKRIEYLQSNLKFKKLVNGGYVNSSVIFLHFDSSNIPDIVE